MSYYLLKRTFSFVAIAVISAVGFFFLDWYSMDATEAIAKTDWSYARYPLRLKDFVQYTSPYGYRTHPISGDKRFHAGIDIAADTGVPTLAWWKGKVDSAVYGDNGGCGLEVVVVSGRWDYRYCHLSEVTVKIGQEVNAGDVIGKVGTTGGSTGPHLHWELRFKQELLDPGSVIKAMIKSTATLDKVVPNQNSYSAPLTPHEKTLRSDG